MIKINKKVLVMLQIDFLFWICYLIILLNRILFSTAITIETRTLTLQSYLLSWFKPLYTMVDDISDPPEVDNAL